jgi:Leucine-rich repeat (LRR) protein
VEVGQRNKRLVLIAIALLAIIVAVAVGVGVGISNKDDKPDGTTQPTALPTPQEPDRSEVFQEFLAPISGELLKDMTSPQYQALNWLANNDTANMTIGVDSEAAIKTRYVAAVLYYAFQGDTWTNKYSFLSDRETCSWNQMFFDGYHGLSCGADGTVESFQTPSNNLVGSIPREIGYYTNLINLTLSNNMIDGSIASLVNLTRLQLLNCSLNALTGTLPEFLFTHRSLTDIDLQDNHFSGSISYSLGTSDQLRVFWARNNSLTGTIPSAVGQSWVLGSLILSSNQLTGTIPDFVSSSRLWNLHLAQNKLTGTIPTTIGSLSALKTFHLAGNGNGGSGISGRIPSELGKCQNLFSLWLDNNTLAESIPTELGSLPFLETLSLWNNRLSGDIPIELSQCTRLTYAGFGANYLTGDIGPVIDSFPRSLQNFFAGGNNIGGTIPTTIGLFSNLVHLDFGRNAMNGTIPSQFGDATSLESLRLGGNNFAGALPTSIASLPNLMVLHVYGNDLTGSLDEFCTVWNDPLGLKSFAANTCGESDGIACPCCNQCCSIDIFECRAI